MEAVPEFRNGDEQPFQVFSKLLDVTDKSKIYQVMVNLIKNAVKFTEEGCIKLGCHQPDEENISFSIQVSGIGISEDQQDAGFDFFRQSEGQDHTK